MFMEERLEWEVEVLRELVGELYALDTFVRRITEQVLGEVASFLGSLGAEQLSAGCRSRGSSLATRIDFVTRRSSSRPGYCALISNTPA